MNDQLWAVLIASVIGPSLLLAVNRLTGGWRRDKVGTDGEVAAQWQGWAAELKERVIALEEDVAELKAALESEREKNQRQSHLMRSLVRWALLLRDEVIRLGGHVPPAPAEVEAALTNLDA